MKICHALVCFIFLTALHNGNTGRVQAGVPERRGVEGGNIRVRCEFSYFGTKRFFCRGTCGEKNNILIATTKNTDKKGRYSIEYVSHYFLSSDFLYVSITQLKESDTGLYMCYLADTWGGGLSYQFYLLVTAATAATRTTRTTRTTPSKSSSFSSETSTSSSASSVTSKQPESSPAGSGPLPYVCLILALTIVALSAALVIFCKRSGTTKPEGAPLETKYADITQANHLYEEIRDSSSPMEVSSAYPKYFRPDGGHRGQMEAIEANHLYEEIRDSSSPMEVSSAYPKYSRPDGDMDFYSLVTAPQSKAEGDANNLDYAEVDFSHIRATNSAPCGNATDVVFSTPLVHARPANHIKDTSPPLYSTVGKHQ